MFTKRGEGLMANNYLRTLIVNKGFTQSQFAQEMGMSRTTLSNIIAGKNFMGKHRVAIANYFNKPVEKIFKGEIKK
jgi:transcriptional regulator with XRE-family HTH domain